MREEFENTLAAPLQTNLVARQLTNQIEFVVLSMWIPHTVIGSNGVNSTTSALFYGFKPDETAPPGLPDSCSLPAASSNSYAGSEDIFRNVFPGATNYLVTMITASNLAQAKQIIDQGVNSDGTFPTQTVVLAKTSDTARNVRHLSFDNAIFNTRLRGNYSMVRTNSDSPLGETNLLGYQTGLYQFDILPDVFAPGAMADSLTSFGGVLFQPNDQTTLLAFTGAGAAGSYGTVVEPCNHLEKFPSPQNYFYQARGFSLAESYYQSLTNPYQGLIVGEPLAAPFAQTANGSWSNLAENSVLTGTTNLSLQFDLTDTQHPIQQVDLFLDGIFFKTLTNVQPISGNRLSVTIAGNSTNIVLLPFASIKSAASDLTARLNTPAFTNATKTIAFAHGDRIELQSLDPALSGSQISITVSNDHIGLGGNLQTFISASRTNFLDDASSNLPPRNHLYITAGTTNLAVTFTLNTTLLSDGFHEFTAVAYEGSHVRTQTRITRNVRVQNTSLAATFTPLFGGTNFAVEGTAQFSVVANTNNISKIELFSTGGLLASSNQPSAVFSITGTNLGVGLHPFYAIVTATDGKIYRTETKWIRLVGVEPAFGIYVSRFPLTISWTATAGRSYDVFSTTNFAAAFQLRATTTATNGIAQWIEPQPDSSQRFYRIRVSP